MQSLGVCFQGFKGSGFGARGSRLSSHKGETNGQENGK